MDWISKISGGGGQTKSATVRFFPGSAPAVEFTFVRGSQLFSLVGLVGPLAGLLLIVYIYI